MKFLTEISGAAETYVYSFKTLIINCSQCRCRVDVTDCKIVFSWGPLRKLALNLGSIFGEIEGFSKKKIIHQFIIALGHILILTAMVTPLLGSTRTNNISGIKLHFKLIRKNISLVE